MPNRVRVSRVAVTSEDRYRVRLSRVSASTVAPPAGPGSRVRVSRVRASTATPPTAVSRVRVSRVQASTANAGAPAYLWLNGALTKVSMFLWLNGEVVPITSPSSVVLPPDPPAPTDVYGNTYNDTY